MTAEPEISSLAREVLAEGNRELRMLAARGVLPLPMGELVELQVALTRLEDEEVAETARRSLDELDPKRAAGLIREGLGPQAVTHLALSLTHPTVLEAVLVMRTTPFELLAELAPRLGPEMQEVLLLRQDAIVEAPGILDALEANPRLSSYARRRVREYREHLLPRREPRRPPSAQELEAEAEELTQEEVDEAVQAAAVEPAEGPIDELTGLSESQVRTLPMPVRLRLTRGAPRILRSILVRDNNPQVAISVLRFNAVAENEVEDIASNRAVRSEVLDYIGKQRGWVRRYSLALALVRNPRCPPSLAMRLVTRLSVRDLRSVSLDRAVPHEVRAAASRLYRIKAG